MNRDRFPVVTALVAAIAVALGVHAEASANTISVDGVTCTLANAITSANNGTASGGCVAGSDGADTIVLAADLSLGSELPPIISDIAFDGALHAIDGGLHRPFFIGDAQHAPVVSFSDITLEGAKAQGGYGILGGGGGGGLGGAVFVYDGSVSFEGVTFNSNQAVGGAASGIPVLTNGYAFGGGGGGGMSGDGGAGGTNLTFSGSAGGGAGFGGGGGGGGASNAGEGGGGGGKGGGPLGGAGGLGGTSPQSGGLGGFGSGGGGGGDNRFGGEGGFGGGGGGGGGSVTGSNTGNGAPGGFGGGGGAGGYVSGAVTAGGLGGFGGGGGTTGALSGSPGAGGFGAGAANEESGGGGAGLGGALFVRSGEVYLHAVTFIGNAAGGGSSWGPPGSGKGGAVFVVNDVHNPNGNDAGMPAALPVVTGCANSFSTSFAAGAGNTARDNADTFGTDRVGLALPCNDRVFAGDFDPP